ncbi:MAG: Holliday junction resolvase RuvX [Bacteroidales bacterium]|nr:Holliday junction resolvase RuvX [Bacteroidales bacterium]
MGRILAIDYGRKRVGLAVTDEFKIIANPLVTVHAKDLIDYLKDYTDRENVERFVVGEPLKMDDTPSEAAEFIDPFVKRLKKLFPHIPVDRIDERYTSKMASRAMVDMGTKKKKRQKKENIDLISAVLILQAYMESMNI